VDILTKDKQESLKKDYKSLKCSEIIERKELVLQVKILTNLIVMNSVLPFKQTGNSGLSGK